MPSSLGAYVSQIAFSVRNLEHAVRFYRDTFRLRDSGGTTAFRGPGAAYVQGVEGIASRTHWLQDDRSTLQLEFLQFEYPPLVPIPDSRRVCDIGMSRIAFTVPDLDACLARAAALGARAVGSIMTVAGGRRAVITDPDGVWIEITEDRRSGQSRVAGVALSVRSLSRALETYTTGMGLTAGDHADDGLDAQLGLAGAERAAVRIDGGPVWIELSEYRSPAPQPWREGHQLTDIGLSHVAVTAPSAEQAEGLFQRLYDGGWVRPNQPKPLRLGKLVSLMYGRDAEGFTLEMMHVAPVAHGILGFRPPRAADRWLLATLNAGAALLYG
ncbi:catechol 2,3-dioxygenase-like lactoylglutathione lyase family enzyme [Fluviicoccus keumensis]|uniref:Catechol 2,3-dioxygenase-like lactoylglutathione lyase family enzyme n=1 Tax=Fluviicoccus keumensis TaxID=1435465 RepID=A0A4Q7YNJ2_9GAMM|nr:VOC family protein [Fluviicoccus keumensis]RZU38564.1 catechol 2,3-dioxygenase-like lactoylglutathione lyase family enzyme [Fluviicoccus keumensis]